MHRNHEVKKMHNELAEKRTKIYFKPEENLKGTGLDFFIATVQMTLSKLKTNGPIEAVSDFKLSDSVKMRPR